MPVLSMSMSNPKFRHQAKPSFNLHLFYMFFFFFFFFFFLSYLFIKKFMIQNIKQSGFGCFLAWLVTLSPETERISIIILYIIQYVHYLRLRVLMVHGTGFYYHTLFRYLVVLFTFINLGQCPQICICMPHIRQICRSHV